VSHREKSFVGSPYITNIVLLYEKGYSPREIGHELQKDRTTILHHLRKLGLVWNPPPHAKGVSSIPRQYVKKQNPWVDYDGEKLNAGKTYRQYLKAAGKTDEEIKRLMVARRFSL